MTTLKLLYGAQRAGAKKRGIEWHFTFDSWLSWWGTDIVNRGPYRGQLVMARYGDTGPYHPSNVRKATVEENIREARLGKVSPCLGKPNGSKRSDANKQSISKANSKPMMTPDGNFKSLTEASKFYNRSLRTISERMSKYPHLYYYL